MILTVFESNFDKRITDIWDSFIVDHPNSSIFQSPHYYQLFAGQQKFKPVAILLLDENQKVSGVLSGIIQYQLPGVLKPLSARCIVKGGPLVKNNDPLLLEVILEAFVKVVQKEVVYSQVRNLFNIEPIKEVFLKSGYVFRDHLNILVDITQPEEILWKSVHKQKRYEIRRAEREGLAFRPIATISDLQVSYKLLCLIYNRIRLPVFPFAVFENAFTLLVPKGMANFWGAYHQGQLVGTMYILCYNGRIYDYFAGSDSVYNYKFPNSLIPWQVMMWGKSNGMTLFDWGGAGKPGVPYGVRDYKEKFGGTLVNYGRFEKIHKPLLFRIAKIAFGFWQRIKT